MEIKYFVRTTGERELDNSFSQIEYELLIDKEHKPLKSLKEQLEHISEYNAVLLEDDIILCKDFKNRIEEVIDKYPDKIINFFNAPQVWQEIIENDNFCFSQCRYYPKGIGHILAEQINIHSPFQPCIALSSIAQRQHIPIMQYRPHLVQHLDLDSSFNIQIQYKKYARVRRSYYFIDYLDELGITYEEASIEENKLKLIELMNKNIKGIDNK